MIKINTLHSKLSKALKEPKSALDYLFRMRKLSTFLPELPDLKNKERLKIKKFFEEASEVRSEVEAVFNPSASACRTPDLEVRLLPPSVIYSVVRATKPEIVVETGVNNGISTYFILSALERNDSGLLYSIDIKEWIFLCLTVGILTSINVSSLEPLGDTCEKEVSSFQTIFF